MLEQDAQSTIVAAREFRKMFEDAGIELRAGPGYSLSIEPWEFAVYAMAGIMHAQKGHLTSHYQALTDECLLMREDSELLDFWCSEYIRHPDRIDRELHKAQTPDDVKDCLINYKRAWRKTTKG